MVFDPLSSQIIPYILDIFQMPLKVMVGAPPCSNIITSIWSLIDILEKLSNIPTEITMVAGCSNPLIKHPIIGELAPLLSVLGPLNADDLSSAYPDSEIFARFGHVRAASVSLASGCAKSGHSQTSFASRTFNTEYYSTINCMHIIVYVYQDFASLEKSKLCCRLNKMQNGHLSCLMADIS